MSDSLRDQLLGAGFKESTKKKKNQGRTNKPAGKNAPASNRKGTQATENPNEAIAKRKQIKAEIKTIIEAEKIEKYAGEIKHSYLVGKRIKEVFVNEDVRKQLISGEVVITRLNGATYLVPSATGEKVQSLNPDWVVFTSGGSGKNSTHDDQDDDYADYQVPDDLQW